MAFETPDLPYQYDALEPHIDEMTMRTHHDKHHVGYTTKLNAAIAGGQYAEWTIERLLRDIETLPSDIRGTVRNNGGGHYNHSFFWPLLSSSGGGRPSGELAESIDKGFGGFDQFKQQFSNAAATQFGSGWAWLTMCDGKLEVTSTPNQNNPISDGKTPILGLDVWEHAYYLKYQNQRPKYIAAFFELIDWKYVARNFANAR